MTIEQRINELAKKIVPDYPNIENKDAFEQLWAIEQSFEGTELALKDWSNLVDELAIRFSFDKSTILEISNVQNLGEFYSKQK